MDEQQNQQERIAAAREGLHEALKGLARARRHAQPSETEAARAAGGRKSSAQSAIPRSAAAASRAG